MSEYRKIPLSQGKEAIVDAADFEWLSRWKWYAMNTEQDKSKPPRWYARRTEYWFEGGKRRQRGLYMHRFILSAPKGIYVDHKNHVTLDNRRDNIRICTPRQNSRNKRAVGKTSRFKGVSFNGYTWTAYCDGQEAYYYKEINAARARDRMAIEQHGEFASLNFSDSTSFDWQSFDTRVRQAKHGAKGKNIHRSRGMGGTKSGFRGVYSAGGGFIVRVRRMGQIHYGGYFKDPGKAAIAYDKIAISVYGEDAVLNFPESEDVNVV